MTYKDNFIAVLKSQGKIIREQSGGIFLLPFNKNYSIYMKNNDQRRCVVTITVDGKSIGDDLVINGLDELDLKRFVDTNNKFKFIKKTESVVEAQGDNINDGFIVISVKWEQSKLRRIANILQDYYTTGNLQDYRCHSRSNPNTTWDNNSTNEINPIISRSILNENSGNTNDSSARSVCSNNFSDKPEHGVTAKGGKSKQRFAPITVGELDPNGITLTLHLKGNVGEDEVTKLVYTNSKLRCKSCGKKIKASDKFCSKCGDRITEKDKWVKV